MGQKVSGMVLKERFYDAIVCDQTQKLNEMLQKDGTLVHMKFSNGNTTPLCRAACLRHRAIAELLISYGADINTPSADGNTPAMWAAHQGDLELVNFFLQKQNLDTSIQNKRGCNLLDVAINRMRYHIAVSVMEKTDLRPKEQSFYEEHQFFNFDVESFLQSLDQARDVDDVNGFLKPDDDDKKKEEKQDLVPDPRQGWKSWFKRVVNFQKKPMVPRKSLPDKLQPQNSIAGKIKCLVHGVNPLPPRRLEQSQMTDTNRVKNDFNATDMINAEDINAEEV